MKKDPKKQKTKTNQKKTDTENKKIKNTPAKQKKNQHQEKRLHKATCVKEGNLEKKT